MVWLITATMFNPQTNEYHTPALQSLPFESKEECMTYLNSGNNGQILIQSLMENFPGHGFVNIGCGEWTYPESISA